VGVVLYMKGIVAKSEWEKVEERGRNKMYGGLARSRRPEATQSAKDVRGGCEGGSTQ
jgi:hypothetical protein